MSNVRMFYHTLRNRSETFRNTVDPVTNWLNRKVTSKMPESLIFTIDKIIYIFDMHLHYFGMFAIGAYIGKLTGQSIKEIAGWVIPLALYLFTDMFGDASVVYNWGEVLKKIEPEENIERDLPNLQGVAAKIINSSKDWKWCFLVGPTGSGKTTLVNDFSQWIKTKDCPDELKNKEVYELVYGKLIRNTGKVSGTYETRFFNLEKIFITQPEDYIFFIDECHNIISEDGNISLANYLKVIPKGVKIIAATTVEGYQKIKKWDPAIENRFGEPIYLNRTFETRTRSNDDDDTIKKLKAHFNRYLHNTGTVIEQSAYEEACRRASEVFPDNVSPRKEIKLIEEAIGEEMKQNNFAKPTKENPITITEEKITTIASLILERRPKTNHWNSCQNE